MQVDKEEEQEAPASPLSEWSETLYFPRPPTPYPSTVKESDNKPLPDSPSQSILLFQTQTEEEILQALQVDPWEFSNELVEEDTPPQTKEEEDEPKEVLYESVGSQMILCTYNTTEDITHLTDGLDKTFWDAEQDLDDQPQYNYILEEF